VEAPVGGPELERGMRRIHSRGAEDRGTKTAREGGRRVPVRRRRCSSRAPGAASRRRRARPRRSRRSCEGGARTMGREASAKSSDCRSCNRGNELAVRPPDTRPEH
jgi:hypothetical protein